MTKDEKEIMTKDEEEIMTKDSMAKFLNQMKVVKEIGAIRKKGVDLEKPFQWLKKSGSFVEKSGWYPEGNCCGYREQFLAGLVGKINVRIVWTTASIGSPTLSIAVDSEAEWIAIRQSLREAGFVR